MSDDTHRTPRILAALGLALTAVVLTLRRLDDWDLPWHLATGRIIVHTRSIPRIDDLAFTHGVLKYTEVASDVVLYLMIRAFGPLGLQVLNGLLGAALAFVLYRVTRRPLSIAIIALTFITIAPWQYIRPATISLLFIALTFLLIERDRDGKRGLYYLVPLQLLWANVHGYAPIGVLLAWLYAVEKRTRGPIVIAALATLATMINTAGPRLLLMVRRFDEDLVGISEWASPTPSLLWRVSPSVFLVLALLVAAFFGREPDGQRKPRLFDVGTLVLALAFFVTAIRFVPVFAVMVTPFIARRLAVRTRLLELASGLAALIPPIAIALINEPYLGVGWYLPYFPEGAAQYIEQRKPAGNMWNFMPFGGYLAWRLHPQFRVFNDGRNALARERALVTRGRLSVADSAEFEFLTRDLHMTWAVTCTIHPYCKGMSQPLTTKDGWRMVFLDDVAAVYTRTDGDNAPLARDGYRVIHHLTSAPAMLDLARSGQRASDLAHDGALAAAQAPNSVRAQTLNAIGALATRDEKTFREALARINALAPDTDAIPTLNAAWASAPR